MASTGQLNRILNAGWDEMIRGRKTRWKAMKRAARRSWHYGGGKKTANKIIVGAFFGAIFVGVSVATAGVGAPAIAAIAVGAYLVGQATDATFAKGSGRQYRGLKKTTDWSSRYRIANGANHSEDAKALNERVHKTMRRAFDHLRRAVQKHRDVGPSVAALRGKTPKCGDAVDLVLATHSVQHHLEKAVAYTYPALITSRLLAKELKRWVADWATIEAKMETFVGKFIDDHGNDSCGDNCLAVGGGGTGSTRPDGGAYALPTADELDAFIEKVDEAIDTLDAFDVHPAPPTPAGVDPHGVARAQLMFADAGRRYDRVQKSTRIKLKHGISSMWSRKTKGEKKAFVVGQVVKGGLSSGSGALSGLGNLDAWTEPLTEAAGQLLDYAAGAATDAATDDDEDSGAARNIRDVLTKQNRSALTAVATRDDLRKTAEHLWECYRVTDALREADPPTDCAMMVDQVKAGYKVKHHVKKAGDKLASAGEGLGMLVKALKVADHKFSQALTQAWTTAARVAAGANHGSWPTMSR